MTEVLGLLLAAGAGRRYGSPKVLAHHGLWLRLAVDALRGGGCGRVLVTLGAADAALPEGAEAVHVSRWADGMGESLRAGLAAADRVSGARYVAVHLVDLTDIDARVVSRVIRAAAGAPSGLARAFFGDRPGHPVVASRTHWAPLCDSAIGDEGGRKYLRFQGEALVRVQCDDLAAGRDQDVHSQSANRPN